MPVPVIAAVAGGVASAGASKLFSGGGGGGGGSSAPQSSGDSLVYRQQAADLYDELLNTLPNFDRSAYNKYSYLGDLTPERINAWIGEGATINPDDAASKASQAEALRQLQEMVDNGWLPQDRLAADKIQRDQSQAGTDVLERGIADMRARDDLGGGTEIALRRDAGQTAAEASNQGFNQMFRDVLQRGSQATKAVGDLSSTMRAADLKEATDQASLNDSFTKAVMAIKNNVNQFNATSANQFALDNRTQQQGINNANVDLDNKAKDRNNQLTQQEFANKSNATVGKSNALGGVATSVDQGQAAAAMRDASSAQMGLNAFNTGFKAFSSPSVSSAISSGLSSLGNTVSNWFSPGASPEATSTTQANDNGSGYGYFKDGGLVTLRKKVLH